MRHRSEARLTYPIQLVTAVFLMALPMPALGHEAGGTIPDPGFRPDSRYAPAFVDALGDTSIAVYPTIVRREARTAHSFASRDQIIAALGEEKIAAVVSGNLRIDLGRLPQASQWEMFQNSRERIASKLRDRQAAAEYHLFMEFLFPVEHTVFGIQCYVLDRNGENAFSFLLNSHHRMFTDARLTATSKSLDARNDLIEEATRVGVAALAAQIETARERAGLAPIAPSPEVRAGIPDDVELHTTSGTGRTVLKETPVDDSRSVTQDSLAPGGWPAAKGRLCADTAKVDYPINELPMYGHARKTPEQQRADQRYIETMTGGSRSREDAAESAARLGWNSYYAADCATAMRRFNQAWLLDPDNRLALWGFAVISLERGEVEAATRYFRMAIETGPEDPTLRQDYETALSMLD